jgi:sarcosine oxidase
MHSLDAEVVVVGAGVMGLATARALARGGRDVVLLEQFRVGHARGSSHGSSRIFRLSYPDPQWVGLAVEALPLWQELEVELGVTVLERHGSLDFGDWEPNRLALAANGIGSEVLGRAEIERRFPLRAGAGEHGLWEPTGGILRADLAQEALLDSGVAAGVRLLEETKVTALEHERDAVRVSASGLSLCAGSVVVTAGAWARGLLAPVGVELAVVATRETVSYFSLEHEGEVPSVIDPVEGEAPDQLGYALAAPGIGLKAGIHHTGAVTDPDENAAPDLRLAEWTADWVGRRFCGAASMGAPETCIYTNTADESFLLQHLGRIVVGSACSGHGFKFAPAIGERLAALVNGRGLAPRA